ncbi:AI-2E family transporter [Sanguibacter suaedae]|uniref:AI-2E family transporter n=1 Tax=Sanguibacter suaedae TaxID=2795737 RepID=A0A934I5Y6_9MICO|nr:AI-2E family transporter [Sanguibacter suaedae]MBI9114856.1 AI-2E family transporter [Sanguibacter suaedae]
MKANRTTPRPLWQDSLGRAAVRSAQVLLVLALATCVVLALVELKLVVIPILIASIIAAAVSPVVRFLRNRGLPAALATWAAMLTGIGVLGAVGWLIGRAVRSEWDELVSSAGQGVDELQRFATEGPLGLDNDQLDAAREQATELLQSDGVQSGAIAGATAAAEVVTGLLLGAVILFFLLKDGRKIFEFLIKPLDDTTQDRAKDIGNQSVGVLGGYVRGTAIVALVDALVIGIALAILGVPLALPLATIVFLGAFIPLVGATASGILAALVALVANGPVTALIVIIVVIAVNQLEGDLLAPVVIGRALSLHPLVILLALTIGTILSGIIGALLAVPIAAVAWTVVKGWAQSSPDREPAGEPATLGAGGHPTEGDGTSAP